MNILFHDPHGTEAVGSPMVGLYKARAHVTDERYISEETLRMFLGWLSGDIKALHRVPVGALSKSWEDFLTRLMLDSVANPEAKS
jgi:hypothetical protein